MGEPGVEAAFLRFVGRTGDLEWCGFMDLEDVRWFWNEATKQERERSTERGPENVVAALEVCGSPFR